MAQALNDLRVHVPERSAAELPIQIVRSLLEFAPVDRLADIDHLVTDLLSLGGHEDEDAGAL